MTRQFFFVTIIYLLNSFALSGKCPDRALLWKRLVYLQDSSSSVPFRKQLSELLTYEQNIKECPDIIDSTYALLLLRIGACYFHQSEYSRAIEYYRRSIHLIDANENKPSINDKYLAGCYFRLALCYDSLNDITEKMKAIDSCVSIAIRKNTVDQSTVYSLEKSVEYFKDIGDFARCVHYAKLGMVLSENYNHDLTSTEYYMIFLEREVEALIVLERFNEAEEIISPNLFSSRIDQIKKAGAWGYLATLYDQYAEVLTNKKDYENALLWFGRAISYDEMNKNFLGCAITTENIGYHLYLHQLNDYDKAIAYYFKALRYTERQLKSAGSMDESDIRIERLNLLDNIANTYLAKGRNDSALVYFQKAFDQIKPGMNEMILLESSDRDFLSNKSIRYVLGLIIDKADATMQWGITSRKKDQVERAIIIYKTADKLLSRIRAEQTEFTSKLFWRSDTRRLYDHAIEASYLTNNTDDAFYFFEKSRAVLLSDQLGKLNKISNGEIINQATLKKKILQLETELNSADRHSNRYGEIQTELFKEKQQSDLIEKSIKQNNPVYYHNYVDTTFFSLMDIQHQILKNHQGLLEIFSGDEAIYTLLITASQAFFNKINKSDFDSTANLFEYYLSNIPLLNSRYDDFVKTAGHLYRLIFRDEPVPDGRIIVSPDAHFFPFEALVNNSKSVSPEYFLDHHALSYTYSARFLMTYFLSGTTGKRNFLGVAPVTYPSGSHLTVLSGSEFSLNKIASYFANSKTFVTSEASRQNFQKHFSTFEIIQLYTHASDSSSHDEPVIFFADSALYLSDLIPENKPLTRLIVLSACETGMGKLNLGEGVFSFNRGFASLGIPSSITNLWSVDNESTYRITELFYKYLSKGEPIDVALQKAKIDFIKHSSRQNKLPYYWAAAILAGKSDAIEVEKTQPWKDILIIFLLVTISFLILKRWKGSKF